MSIENNCRVLIVDLNINDPTIKNAFFQEKDNATKKAIRQLSGGKIDIGSGIEGLSKLIASGKNSGEVITDYDYVNKVQTEYCGPVTSMDYLGVDPSMEMDVVPMWSLHSYKDALNEKQETPEVDRAWDELEKSIVASLSDDVLVGVAGDKATLTILKKF